MAIIGIDLGTTNSLGAFYRNGNVRLVPNRYGSFLTPSVVSLNEDGTIMVGMAASQKPGKKQKPGKHKDRRDTWGVS